MVGFILIAIVATGERKMDDTIYRQTAIKALNTEIIKRRLLDDVNDGMLDEFDTESILRALPSADAHQVVRCKDCNDYQTKFKWCKLHDGEMQPTDFCSYGERRDG